VPKEEVAINETILKSRFQKCKTASHKKKPGGKNGQVL
jgi:hypothetical protein